MSTFLWKDGILTLATYSLTNTVKKEAIIILRLVHSSKCWHRPKEINDRCKKTERKKSFVWRHNNGWKVFRKEHSNFYDLSFQERFILSTKIDKISCEKSKTSKFIILFQPIVRKQKERKSFVHLENTYSDNILEMHKTIA